ncbi:MULTISPECIES: hypothetical protein [Pontibacter]|uniref:Lipocalin-like domain-containing protein n=1 Tax=Pontibacter lucknowensis TaxID=1077936 RepID=A0A1N6ZF07_9BACT|nr:MULTISPECIES: hypothetical protein [Pontibacter]SIR25341.1 hypothetical protein SAMN05421545_2944 [Pontibacter lucknowensis]
MKKLFLLPILFALVFTSCSDDDDNGTVEPAVSEIDAQMRGDWTNTMIKRVYYSIDDEIMFTDSVQYQTNFSFDGKRLTVTVPGGTPEVMNYSFPDPADTTLIELQRGNDKGQYKVTAISDTEMTWVEEKPWAGFPEEAPESEKTTSRLGLYTWKFVRKN